MADNNRAITKRKKGASPATPQRTNYLLIIGIDKYSNGIAPLNNAVRDAKNFRDTLWKYFQFEEANTTCLFDEEATRNKIIETFSQLLNKLTKKDNLIFYYSGHGEQVDVGNGQLGYWIPYDATLQKTWSYLPNAEINNLFKLSNAHHVFGIVDSCYSGSLFQTRSLSTMEERVNSFPSRWLLTAGRLELVADGSLGKNSPFATSLLTYLQNTNDQAVWVSDLCNFVLKGMKYNTNEQTPRGEPLQGVGHYGGQFVFYKKDYVPTEDAVATPIQEDGVSRSTNTRETISPTPASTIVTKKEPSSLAELKDHLNELIIEDLKKALDTYKNYLKEDSSKSKDIIQQLSRYTANKKREQRGTASEDHIRMEYNKIKYALIDYVDELDEGDVEI